MTTGSTDLRCDRPDCPAEAVPKLREMVHDIAENVSVTRATSERTGRQVDELQRIVVGDAGNPGLQKIVIGDGNGNPGLVRKMDRVTDRVGMAQKMFWLFVGAVIVGVVNMLLDS